MASGECLILTEAIHYQRCGGPEILSNIRRLIHSPAANEILIRIHAITGNRTDCGFLRGRPLNAGLFSGLRAPKSKTLGCEFDREVAQRGEDVRHFYVGDRVAGLEDNDFGYGGDADTPAEAGMVTALAAPNTGCDHRGRPDLPSPINLRLPRENYSELARTLIWSPIPAKLPDHDQQRYPATDPVHV